MSGADDTFGRRARRRLATAADRALALPSPARLRLMLGLLMALAMALSLAISTSFAHDTLDGNPTSVAAMALDATDVGPHDNSGSPPDKMRLDFTCAGHCAAHVAATPVAPGGFTIAASLEETSWAPQQAELGEPWRPASLRRPPRV